MTGARGNAAALQGPRGLILLAGQSNMAGRGPLPGTPVGYDAESQPGGGKIPILSWTSASEWGPAQHPLHYDKPDKVGVGPGLSFALAAARSLRGGLWPSEPPRRVSSLGLVPAAVGGSAIIEWLPGSGALLRRALTMTSLALAASPSGSFVACVLWHQGETDSETDALASLHRARLEDVLRALSQELGPVPVLLGGLGSFLSACPTTPAWQIVDTGIREAAASSGPQLRAYVPAAGLKDRGDSLHFDTKSAEEFGERYAVAWFNLCDSTASANNAAPARQGCLDGCVAALLRMLSKP